MSGGASAAPPRLPDPPAWSRELCTVGVTGTNGKTSTTWLVAAALARLRAPVAQATTVGSFLDRELLDVPRNYHGFIATMRAGLDRGGRFAAIELTSEALALGFARAWPCRVGIFTNLTRDHLDAHKSAEHYLASKAQLFLQLPPGGVAVLNAADPASELLAEVVPDGVRVLRYAVPSRGEPRGEVDVLAQRTELSWEGTEVTLAPSGSLALPAKLGLRAIGDVYVENALAALAAAVALGLDGDEAAAALAEAPAPPGRFELVGGPPQVVVDYAHTPDALTRALAAARVLCPAGRVTVVFGAGGGRDKPKRPLMGEAAATADRVVLTSDNPRHEDPAAIAAQIREGIDPSCSVTTELDRARAIEAAVRDAGQDDVVLIAGKGHEDTQTVGDQVRPFDDREVARRVLAARCG